MEKRGFFLGVILALLIFNLLSILLFFNLPLNANGNPSFFITTASTGPVKATFLQEASSQEKTAAPVFSPLPGTYDNPISIALSCPTSGSTIYYTIDGSDPLSSTTKRQFRRAITIPFTTVIRAVAVKKGLEPSAISEGKFIIRVARPEAWPGPGEWRELPKKITITCPTPGASIFYTLDGSTPTRESLKYEGPIVLGKEELILDKAKVIKAIAIKDDGSPESFEATFVYQTKPNLVALTDILQPGADIQDIINKVISEMTLEEKVRLVWGVSNSIIGAAGNTFPAPRLGIVSLDLADGPAGVRLNGRTATAWPNPLTLASSWNVSLLEQIGAAVGREAKYYGVDIMLSPGMNINRDPLGGRVFEYYAEDPLLAGKMAAAYIRGIENQGIGATMKHYAANNFENNRTNIDEIISERALREIYLPHWEMAIKEASPWALMTAYNKVNGEWCAENKYLLKTLEEFGFDGVVMSDWGGYHNPVAYARGFDLNMPGRSGWEKLIEAIQNRVISEENLNQAVSDILKVMVRTETFKRQIYDKADFAVKKQLTEELKAAHKILAVEAEAEGIVLLKNAADTLPFRNFLPVALIGSTAIPEYRTVGSSPAKGIIFEGGGSARVNVDPNEVISLAEALGQSGFSVLQKNAVHAYLQEGLTEADAQFAAENSEAAIILIGRPGQEGVDNTSLELTAAEKDMIKKVGEAYHQAGKKVVVLLNVAYPIIVDWDDYADSVVYIGLPGTYGALAVIQVLTGRVNPSGKLVDTWPRAYSLAPTYGNMPKIDQPKITYSEDIFVGYRYYDYHPEAVKYPFGYGLSYTTFSYKKLSLNKTSLNISNPRELLLVTVDVENTGKTAGKEVAELYIKPVGSRMKRPLKELKQFAKTRLLEPGEQEHLTFVLSLRDFAFWDEKAHAWAVTPGQYDIIIGGTSADAGLIATGTKTRLQVRK